MLIVASYCLRVMKDPVMPCALRREACQCQQLEESKIVVMEAWKMGKVVRNWVVETTS